MGELIEHVAGAAAEKAPENWVKMPSGAAHDAQTLAKIMPAAMLFIPSINGISHNFEENTVDEDIVLGCEVYVAAVASMARAAAEKAARVVATALEALRCSESSSGLGKS